MSISDGAACKRAVGRGDFRWRLLVFIGSPQEPAHSSIGLRQCPRVLYSHYHNKQVQRITADLQDRRYYYLKQHAGNPAEPSLHPDGKGSETGGAFGLRDGVQNDVTTSSNQLLCSQAFEERLHECTVLLH